MHASYLILHIKKALNFEIMIDYCLSLKNHFTICRYHMIPGLLLIQIIGYNLRTHITLSHKFGKLQNIAKSSNWRSVGLL